MKDKLCKMYGIETYDTALPQDWVNKMNQVSNENPSAHFVWAYNKGEAFGCPVPLTAKGCQMLREFNTAHGTQYPIPERCTSYYQEELLQLEGKFLTVQFAAEKGKTKYMNVNTESIPVIIDFLIQRLLK